MRCGIVSGIRFGRTMGSPITFIIENRDYKNWQKRMSADPSDRGEAKVVTRPRPGHADLAGVLKYNLEDIRDVLERASARETTARVAIGAFAQGIARAVRRRGARILSSVSARPKRRRPTIFPSRNLRRITEESQVRMADADAERAVIAEIDACKKTGDTLGGIVEVDRDRAAGRPRQLRAMGSQARRPPRATLLSLQAVKGVEVGWGFKAARVRGSELHDEIGYDREEGHFTRHVEQLGRHRRRHVYRRAAARARRIQAALHPDAAAASRPISRARPMRSAPSNAPMCARFRPPR